jgi:AcrR family transcriptional regulator
MVSRQPTSEAADRMNTPAAIKISLGDEYSSKRRQILDGARRVFMKLGFDGASMGEIAKAAGVSKGTLYVYFNDKNALFEAMVEEIGCIHNAATLELDPNDDDIATTLRRFGTSYMDVLCKPQGGSAVRTVMAIAERMPEIGRRYYGFIVSGWISKLALYIEAQTKAGRLAIDDHELAATQFMLSCQATLFLPFVFQATPAPSADRIAKVVDSAIRMFLAAYQVKAN